MSVSGKCMNSQTGDGINFASKSKAGLLSAVRLELNPPLPRIQSCTSLPSCKFRFRGKKYRKCTNHVCTQHCSSGERGKQPQSSGETKHRRQASASEEWRTCEIYSVTCPPPCFNILQYAATCCFASAQVVPKRDLASVGMHAYLCAHGVLATLFVQQQWHLHSARVIKQLPQARPCST